MILVIVGAGASFDSVSPRTASRPFRDPSISPLRPPLARELFAEREDFLRAIDRYPDSRELVFHLRALAPEGGTTVEEALESYEQQAETYPRRRVQLAAIRFYLRSAILACDAPWRNGAHGITNYLALAGHLQRWQVLSGERVVLVTFNYDTHLESAWTHESRKPIDTMESFLDQPNALIVKVHGSVTWGRIVQSNNLLVNCPGGIEQGMIDNISKLPITKDYELVGEGAGSLLRTNTDYSLPAIAVPLRTKTSFECPEEHLLALASSLPTIRRLLVVGWAGADEHFLDFCENNGLTAVERTLIVNGSEEATKTLIAALRSHRIAQREIGRASYGFSELMTDHLDCLAWLLAK